MFEGCNNLIIAPLSKQDSSDSGIVDREFSTNKIIINNNWIQ